MFILIWVTLLWSDTVSQAKSQDKVCANDNLSITSHKNITAEAGLCVVLPCLFKVDFAVHSITWYKRNGNQDKPIFHSNKTKETEPEFEKRVSLLEPDLSMGNYSIIINDLNTSDSGSYQLRVVGKDDCKVTCRVTIIVKDLTQKPTVEIPPLLKGQQTTLTCKAPGLCSGSVPKITWMWRETGGNDSHIEGNITDFKKGNLTVVTQGHSSMLTFIPSGEHNRTMVTCKASFNNGQATEETKTLDVSLFSNGPRILSSSACRLQSNILTCTCLSEGLPLPTIKWPLLENYTKYTVMTTVSNHTVNSTITMKYQSNSAIDCVSNNGIREKKENLNITKPEPQKEDIFIKLLNIINQLEVIIALLIGFLLGIFLSAIIACLAKTCRRKKLKPSRDLTESLEMVVTEALPQVDAGQEAEDEGIHDQEETEEGADSARPSAPEGDARSKEVEYSNIDFSVMKRKNPTETEMTQESTETEYAEVKRKTSEEAECNVGEDGEILEGNEENEGMMGQDEETKECGSAVGEGHEEVALYSNMNEIMGEN